MGDNNTNDEKVPIDDLTPEEVSRIIHSHRKVRYGQYFVYLHVLMLP